MIEVTLTEISLFISLQSLVVEAIMAEHGG